MQIQISWLLQKSTDLDLHCFLRQSMSCLAREELIPLIQKHRLDLNSISNDIITSQIYDKRDDFYFDIINFAF